MGFCNHMMAPATNLVDGLTGEKVRETEGWENREEFFLNASIHFAPQQETREKSVIGKFWHTGRQQTPYRQDAL